jgi:phospholipase A1
MKGKGMERTNRALLSRRLAIPSLAFLWLLGIPGPGLSETPSALSECAKIENDADRLQCYDRLAEEAAGKEPEREPLKEIPEKPAKKTSYFSKLWELDPETRRGPYSIAPYRSNYVLPLTYNALGNGDVSQGTDSGRDMQNWEVKFQLSLKVKLWEEIFGREADLWFGYTQLSFWQLYDFKDSSPFRETDYEPEFLLNFKTRYRLLGLDGRFIQVGLNHQSNGQSEPLSRSWNRIVANLGFEKNDLSLLLKGWYRIPESAEEDDNPDIEDYLGYGEFWANYIWNKHRFGVMVRNNLQFHQNRGALQLEWSFPLIPRVSGYLQYFVGYGESLVDYNRSANRIGLGFILTDWN